MATPLRTLRPRRAGTAERAAVFHAIDGAKGRRIRRWGGIGSWLKIAVRPTRSFHVARPVAGMTKALAEVADSVGEFIAVNHTILIAVPAIEHLLNPFRSGPSRCDPGVRWTGGRGRLPSAEGQIQ